LTQQESNWPIIVGLGGIDAGGRWGGPNSPAFGAMLNDGKSLPPDVVVEQLRLMEQVEKVGEDRYLYRPDGTTKSARELADAYSSFVQENLFVRRCSFDSDALPSPKIVKATELVLARADLPSPLPEGWELEDAGDDTVRVAVKAGVEISVPGTKSSRVTSTGAIANGFLPCPEDAPGPAKKKVARNLWLALWAVNDAMKGAGLSFEDLRPLVSPGEIGIYFGSAMGQVCPKGSFGYMESHVRGQRPESTQVAFSLNNTPAAFVAAYTAGSIGHISNEVGACATFMLNLYNAQRDIETGKRRFAIVGAADSAIYPWVIQSYDVMKALAREADLPKDDAGEPLHRFASRPFAKGRRGFVVAEGAFAILLTDRALALELGLPARGLVLDVCGRSDGWKKSITSPGIGDYPALQHVMASVSSTFGEDTLREQSFVSAHGSSTPQNGVTEAKLYRDYAEAFGIQGWKVTALKSFMGHSMGAAGGLQSVCGLLSMAQGVIPKIRNLAEMGVDPELPGERLEFLAENHVFKPGEIKVAIGVSKGFGGFNVAEALAGPQLAQEHLLGGLSDADRQAYDSESEKRSQQAAAYQEAYLKGEHMVDYNSSRPVTADHLTVGGPTSLNVEGYPPFKFD
jgi:acetoacetyl-[acyl-carrier protein] synthase